jgi:hypothetical protein
MIKPSDTLQMDVKLNVIFDEEGGNLMLQLLFILISNIEHDQEEKVKD